MLRKVSVERRVRWPLVLAACGTALVGVLGWGCDVNTCASYYNEPRYIVHVRDADTGVLLCGSTINGQAYDSLTCEYGVPIPETVPEMTLTVSHPGYPTQERVLSTAYELDECGRAINVPVTIQMDPLPSKRPVHPPARGGALADFDQPVSLRSPPGRASLCLMNSRGADLREWVRQRRLAEAREQSELRDQAPQPERALARGLALIAFATRLRGDAVKTGDVSPEDLLAYRRWAAVRSALRGA